MNFIQSTVIRTEEEEIILIGSKKGHFEPYNWAAEYPCDPGYGFEKEFSSESTIKVSNLNGVHIICELNNNTKCYKYSEDNTGSDDFSEILSHLNGLENGELLFVPGQGLVMFTNDFNKGKTDTMILDDSEGKWIPGPEILGCQSIEDSCLVQLNDTTTLFLGGRDNYARRISSYDWSTNKFTVHKTVWHSKHRKGSCAVIKGERGKPLVVLTGDAYKSSTGLEIWNPADERIQIEAIPFEEENNYRLSGVGLTAVNQGRDLLMYGGVWHDAKDSEELWKDWYKEKN